MWIFPSRLPGGIGSGRPETGAVGDDPSQLPPIILSGYGLPAPSSVGASKALAFDLSADTGFVYALTVADQFIRSGLSKRFGYRVEVLSRSRLGGSPPVFFGDGAGAAVVTHTNSRRGIQF